MKSGTTVNFGVGLAGALALAWSAPAIAATLPQGLSQLADDAEAAVIVQFTGRPQAHELPAGRGGRGQALATLKARAAARWRQLAVAPHLRGVREARSLWLIDGLALVAPMSTVRALSQRPDVLEVREDARLLLELEPPSPMAVERWNLNAIQAPQTWALGLNGAGAVVGSLDSGVDATHAELRDRYRGGGNSWFDPYGQHSQPYDASGHGTQTMGLMVGATTGVAPGARWIAARIFDDSGWSQLSRIHLAFQWMLDPDDDPATDDAPHVLNNSWGLSGALNRCDEEFRYEVQVLRQLGIAPVFAAGNNGPSGSTSVSPANYPESLSVGAVDSTLAIASFSSRGPSACDGGIYPKLVAPGSAVVSTDRTYGGLYPNATTQTWGTSFAAPHLSGAFAVLLASPSGWTLNQIEAALMATTTDLGSAGADSTYGHGLLQLDAARARLAGTVAACSDGDADGFFSSSGCGTALDCDDLRAAVHPGATEVRGDRIDQDCNGYDLSIEVLVADYRARRDLLVIEATSALGPSAMLRVDGYGAMAWDKRKGLWKLSVRAGGNPGTVTIRGIEGAVTATLRAQ